MLDIRHVRLNNEAIVLILYKNVLTTILKYLRIQKCFSFGQTEIFSVNKCIFFRFQLFSYFIMCRFTPWCSRKCRHYGRGNMMKIDPEVLLFNLVARKLCSAMGATRSKILDLPHRLYLMTPVSV